jgi:hypothetical protein
VNLTILRELAFSGVPEECKGFRSLVWKILLGYLSDTPDNWLEELDLKRTSYDEFKQEFIIQYQLDTDQDPLATGYDNARWKSYFADQQLWIQIEKDVRRTQPEMHFFFLPTSPDGAE